METGEYGKATEKENRQPHRKNQKMKFQHGSARIKNASSVTIRMINP
jgi:hypothetical protein